MKKISYRGYRFPSEIIQQAIWLYLRFTLSFRDVEDLLAERGIMVSYETVRRWVNHFGPLIAADLRKRRPKPHTIWHLDEVGSLLRGVPEAPLPIDAPADHRTFREIVYSEEDEVGYLSFDFYNGAMSTSQCYRLRDAFLHARSRPTRVIALLGWSRFLVERHPSQ